MGKYIDYRTVSDTGGAVGPPGPIGPQGPPGTNYIGELRGMFNQSYLTDYVEFVKVDGNIVTINTWTTAEKVLKLFTKNISYDTNGSPIGYTVINNISNQSFSVEYIYDGLDIVGRSSIIG